MSVIFIAGHNAKVIFDDSLDLIDFCPSNNVAAIYVSEADIVAGNTYRRKIVKLRKVFISHWHLRLNKLFKIFVLTILFSFFYLILLH